MENKHMLKLYEHKLDQVRYEKEDVLDSKLNCETKGKRNNPLLRSPSYNRPWPRIWKIQSANIDQLVQDSYFTTQNVGQGNKELKKAGERKSTAKMVFYATVCTCAAFTLLDLVT